jgi:acid stress-induced BolA-like protein IbaG/YrbA
MMETEEISQMIESGLPGSKAIVTGDGSHFDAIVISDLFDGKSMLEEQRMVFDTLGDSVTSGRLHALSIKAYTRAEWEEAQAQQGTKP